MRKNTENADIRKMITAAGLFDWQVARRVGISHATLVVWLREPLPEGSDRRQRIMKALADIEAEGGGNGTEETRGESLHTV